MLRTRQIQFDWGDYDLSNHRYSSTTSACSMAIAEDREWDQSEEQLTLFRKYRHTASTNFSSSWGDIEGTEYTYSTKNKRPQFNNMDHRIYRGFNLPYAHFFSRDGSQCNGYYFRRQAPYGAVNDPGPIDNHFVYDLGPAQRQAWHEMQPRFEGDISMFNFLIELKDFKQLGRLLANKPIRKLRNFFRKVVKKRGLVDLSKPIAQTHLANEFALKPLLSDIFKIIGQIDEVVLDAQKSFQDAGLGRNVRHYSEYIPIETIHSWVEYYQNKYPERIEGHVKDMLFTATMDYSYKYSARGPIDAFMRYWGLIPTKEAIWNAIPFSFIIDYFTTVGDSIGAMEHDKNVSLDLAQYCESLYSRSSTGSFLNPAYCLGGTAIIDGKVVDGSMPIHVSGISSTIFTRRVTSPNVGAVLPRIRKPSSKQAANLAALLRCFL